LVLWLVATNRSCSGRRRFLLIGEELEGRCVPASFRWNPGIISSTDFDWNNANNWDIKTGGVWAASPPNRYPGYNPLEGVTTNDEVEFWAGGPAGNPIFDAACYVNVSVTLYKLDVKADNTSWITFYGGNSLTISGSDESEPIPHGWSWKVRERST
jgi:hypothetical protein